MPAKHVYASGVTFVFMHHMFKRYLGVFRSQLFLLLLIIGLVIASSVTKGKTAVTLSILAGIVMILEGISFFIWIIKTPAKKSKDEAV